MLPAFLINKAEEKPMRILNFGSCNIDFVYSVDSIVQPGETISALSMCQYPGGKGLNQSIALARAGAEVYHAGCVGSDGDVLREVLASAKVGITHLYTVDERTGHAIIQVDKNGENSIFIYSGANGMITEEQVDKVVSFFERGDFLLIQNEINNIDYIIKKAHERGLKIILNPSPFNSVIESIDLNGISYLILNEVEAESLSNIKEPEKFISWIAKRYSNLCVVLTLGRKGCLYFCNGEVKYHPAFQVRTLDTTAAGDTFTGYFIAGLSKGNAIGDCIRTASAAAALAAAKEGAAPSIPEIDYVEHIIDSLVPYAGDYQAWQ